MSIDAFSENPWKESHPAYEKCTFFHIRPAPEFATAEVVVSSLYRACGFDVPEKEERRRVGTGHERLVDRDGCKLFCLQFA